MRHYNKSNRGLTASPECLCALGPSICALHTQTLMALAGDLPLKVDHPHPKHPESRWRHRGFCFTCYSCALVIPASCAGAPGDDVSLVKAGLGWPARCSDCNTALKRWRRSRDWADAITAAKLNQPAGRKRMFFVTFTERDEPISRRTADPPMPRWEGVRKTASARTLDLTERCRKLFRTAAWKRHFDGWLWGAECTIRPTSETRCEYRAFTPAGSQSERIGDTVRVFENRLVWKVHPHLHCVAIGARWDLDELDALAARYGLRTNIKMVDGRKSVFRVTRYITKYTVKDQPLVRSHSTAGVVRTAAAELREDRRLARLQDRESE